MSPSPLRILDIGMESSGIPGGIQVTDETCRLLAGRYPFERREGVEVKGKGTMSTWVLDPAGLGSEALTGSPRTG